MYCKRTISDEVKNAVFTLFDDNKSIEQISKETKISCYFVRKIIKSKNGGLSIIDIKSNNKRDGVTEKQIQCIYGSLLGDSSLSRKDYGGFVFSSSHCDKQKDYLIYKSNILGAEAHHYIKGKNSWSPDSIYWSFSYHNRIFLQEVHDNCFADGYKTVSKNWANIINWEGIAYWFMDDGCSHAYKNASTVQANFSTLSFYEPEVDILIDRFNELGVSSHKVKSQHGKGIVLTIDSKCVNYFMDQIEPFVVPCMMYKIKKDNKKW